MRHRPTECPCCKGDGALEVIEMWGDCVRAICTHCDGSGKIVIEEENESNREFSATEQEILERYSTPGLYQNELTRAGKKWHLYDMYSWPLGETEKNRWAANEIEKILNELFPQESHDDRD